MGVYMLAIGNDELGAYVKKGDTVTKSTRGHTMSGVVEYGTDANGKETDMLGFVTIQEGNEFKTSYLVSVKGQLLEGWEIHNV